MKQTILRFYEKYMYVLGIGGHGIFVAQAYKTFQLGHAHDVSLTGFIICAVSVWSWLLYGILLRNKVLIVVNVAGFIASAFCLAMLLFYS